MTGLLIVASLQLALFVCVCGAILYELRRARLEAAERGVGMLGKLQDEEAFLLVLDEELRRVRKDALDPVAGGLMDDRT